MKEIFNMKQKKNIISKSIPKSTFAYKLIKWNFLNSFLR